MYVVMLCYAMSCYAMLCYVTLCPGDASAGLSSRKTKLSSPRFSSAASSPRFSTFFSFSRFSYFFVFKFIFPPTRFSTFSESDGKGGHCEGGGA